MPINNNRSRSPELKLLEKVEGINKDKTVKGVQPTNSKQPVNATPNHKKEIKTTIGKFEIKYAEHTTFEFLDVLRVPLQGLTK